MLSSIKHKTKSEHGLKSVQVLDLYLFLFFVPGQSNELTWSRVRTRHYEEIRKRAARGRGHLWEGDEYLRTRSKFHDRVCITAVQVEPSFPK